MADHYRLGDVPFVSDREKRLYNAFGLNRGSLRQLVGVGVWVRGIRAAIIDGHGVGRPVGDPLQMPGVFLVRSGRVLRSFYHRSVADRPDYVALSRVPDDEAPE